VLVLDDDGDLRETLAELLQAMFDRGCECLASVEELARCRSRLGEFDLAILDINLGAGRPSGLDAYRLLREMGFRGRIVFLTGHAGSHPMVQRALAIGDAVVVEKPITVARLEALLGGR
jgi:FixJ family two-component response regulator